MLRLVLGRAQGKARGCQEDPITVFRPKSSFALFCFPDLTPANLSLFSTLSQPYQVCVLGSGPPSIPWELLTLAPYALVLTVLPVSKVPTRVIHFPPAHLKVLPSHTATSQRPPGPLTYPPDPAISFMKECHHSYITC